jgi:hypothetical protein
MKKARVLLAVILIMAAGGAVMATKARSFIGYIVNAGVYSTVVVPFNCEDVGAGCIYTSWNGATFQVYTLSGARLYPVKP